MSWIICFKISRKKTWTKKERMQVQASTYSPLSPHAFFLSSFLKFYSPFIPSHLNAGRRLTFFNLSRRSSIYWMSWLAFGLALISNFSSTIYHFLLFRCSSICWIVKSRIFLTSTSHIVFSSSSRSSICWMKFRTQNAREEYQNNTPTTSMSILSRFVRLGSLLFFSASSMLALFLLAFSFLLAFLLSFHLKQARLGSFLSARSYISWDEEAEI